MKIRVRKAIVLGSIVALLSGFAVTGASAAEVKTIYRDYKSINYNAPELLTDNLPGLKDQPTATGKDITSLKYFQGRVYVGYGDWGANTGPIDLYSYDATTGESRFEIKIPTEAIGKIKEINGALYIPYLDPKGGWQDASSGYASNRDGSWKLYPVGPMIHGFDMTTSNGTDLFLAGAVEDRADGNKKKAAVWYSADGRTNWQLSLTVGGSSAPNESDRFYWIGSSNGKVFTSADIRGSSQRVLQVWENGSWQQKSLPTTSPGDNNVARSGLNQANDYRVPWVVGDKIISPNGDLGRVPNFSLGNGIYSISGNKYISGQEVVNRESMLKVDASPLANTIDFTAPSMLRQPWDNPEWGTIMSTFEDVNGNTYGMESNTGHIYKTSDRGNSWKYVTSIDVRTPQNVFTVDEEGQRIFTRNVAGKNVGIYSVPIPQTKNTPPEIIVPNSNLVIAKGTAWDPMSRVKAWDSEDKDLTASIVRDTANARAVDTSKSGEYFERYTVMDKNRGMARVTLRVVVADTIPPVIGGNRSGMCVKASNEAAGGSQKAYAGGEGCSIK